MNVFKTLNCTFSDEELVALDKVAGILGKLHDTLLDENCTEIITDECHADFNIREIEEAQTLICTLVYVEGVELS